MDTQQLLIAATGGEVVSYVEHHDKGEMRMAVRLVGTSNEVRAVAKDCHTLEELDGARVRFLRMLIIRALK